MYSYAARVEPDDRWRIAAYIRVLQRSQHAKPSDVPAGQSLDTPSTPGTTEAPGATGTPGATGAPAENGTNANGH